MVCTYTMRYYSAIRMTFCICNNIDEPGGHNTEWNKQVTEKDKCCLIIFIWVIQNSQTHESREYNSGFQSLRGEGNG